MVYFDSGLPLQIDESADPSLGGCLAPWCLLQYINNNHPPREGWKYK